MNKRKLNQFKKNPLNRTYNESALRMKIRSRHKYKKFFEGTSFRMTDNEDDAD